MEKITKKILSVVLAFLMMLNVLTGLIPQNVVHAEENNYGVVGAYKAYSLAKHLYEGDTKVANDVIYIKENKDLSEARGMIAYCFNANNPVPDTYGDANNSLENDITPQFGNLINELPTFTKINGSVGNTFVDLAKNARKKVNSELAKTVLSVIYNGYRGTDDDNSKAIKEAFKNAYVSNNQFQELTTAELYAATQKAIWYYTDSTEPTSEGDSPALTKKIEPVFKFLTQQGGHNLNLQFKKYDGQQTLDLYKPVVTTNSNASYQNLLGTNFVEKGGKDVIKYDVSVKKIEDANKTNLPDAKLKLTSNGNVLSIWKTEQSLEEKKFNLTDGTYILSEIEAPKGYKKADDITFTVTNGSVAYTGKDTQGNIVQMVDKKIPTMNIEVTKVFEEKDEFTAPKISLKADGKDAKDASDNKVESLILSNKNGERKGKFENLPIYKNGINGEKIKYTFEESDALGYKLKDNPEVTGENDGQTKQVKLINVKTDTPPEENEQQQKIIKAVTVKKHWEGQKSQKEVYFLLQKTKNGKSTDVVASDLVNAKNFVNPQKLTNNQVVWQNAMLKEQGYELSIKEVNSDKSEWMDSGFKTPEINFTDTPNGGQFVRAFTVKNEYDAQKEDKKVFVGISKVDSEGQMLPGAKLKITDSENKETIIEEWKSTNESKVVELSPGTYNLVEVKAPEGYTKLSEPQQFVVPSQEKKVEEDSKLYTAWTSPSKYTGENEIKNPIYISPKDDEGNSFVGYCFNLTRKFPKGKSKYQTEYKNTVYKKLNYFKDIYSEMSDENNRDEIEEAILKVIWNGYTGEGQNKYIQTKNNLTDGQFREVTQTAIWKFTDNGSVVSTWSQNMKEAYNELVDYKNLPAHPKNMGLNIYKPYTIDGKEDESYQNLISTKFVPINTIEVKIKNSKKLEPVVVNFELNKKVINQSQVENGKFKFEIYGNDEKSKAILADKDVRVQNNYEKININGIELKETGTYNFTVKEVNTEDDKEYIYDNSEIKVKVDVTKGDNNKLNAKVTYTKNDEQDKKEFVNKYIGKKLITINKSWKDINGKDKTEKLPEKVEFEILANGQKAKDLNGNEVANVVLQNGATSAKVENLPLYDKDKNDANHLNNFIKYTVKELPVEGYTAENTSIEVDSNLSSNITFINKENEKPKQKVIVKKVWDKNVPEELKKLDIFFKLFIKGNNSFNPIIKKLVGDKVEFELDANVDLNKIGVEEVSDINGTIDWQISNPDFLKATFERNNNLFTFTNKLNKVDIKFKKVDIFNKLVDGINIKLVKYIDGNQEKTIESWKTNFVDGKSKEFSLTPGKYKFVETLENNSIYTKAKDISFSILSSGEIEMDQDNDSRTKYDQDSKTITMVNDYLEHEVKFSKQDIYGKELKGATIKVVGTELGSKEERQIYRWLSTGETNTFKLKPGTYKLIEEAAPKGYKIATEISFKVTVEGKIENVKIGEGNRYENGILVMVDDYARTNVKFSKQDIAGKELEGAKIELWRDGEKIDSWTSGKTAKELSLRAGTYTMIETSAPKGYKVSTSITFTVTEDMKITDVKVQGQNKVDAKGKVVVMVDEAIEETKGETRRETEKETEGETRRETKQETKNENNENPETSDAGVTSFVGILLISGLALFVSRKKEEVK